MDEIRAKSIADELTRLRNLVPEQSRQKMKFYTTEALYIRFFHKYCARKDCIFVKEMPEGFVLILAKEGILNEIIH